MLPNALMYSLPQAGIIATTGVMLSLPPKVIVRLWHKQEHNWQAEAESMGEHWNVLNCHDLIWLASDV